MRDLSQHPAYGVTILPSLILPCSSGRVSLSSGDPAVYPTIEPAYLSHELDIKRAVEISKLADKIASSGPLGDCLGPQLHDASIPHPPGTDMYIEEYIRRTAVTIYHPVGTCKKGSPARDPMVVVDPELRVVGVQNLRVADCSIMPRICSGNTNAPAIMIGERCAAFVQSK